MGLERESRQVDRTPPVWRMRGEYLLGGTGSSIMREGRFGQTCDWQVMKFGNKPVSGHRFSSLTNPKLLNSWRTPLRRSPVTWIGSGRRCPLGSTGLSWWHSAGPFAAMQPSRAASNWCGRSRRTLTTRGRQCLGPPIRHAPGFRKDRSTTQREKCCGSYA
jgi:hypothetical protein